VQERTQEQSRRPEWLTRAYPELREHPPWVMSDMVMAEHGLPGPILGNPAAAAIAAAVSEALTAEGGVIVTGCGTSEHAARALAALISDALGEERRGTAVVASQAFEASLEPRSKGVCIGVSHGGTSTATVAALRAARQAGARTCLITAAESSEAHAFSDLVFTTPLQDASWCHTVGYLSPVLAGAAIAGSLGGSALDGEATSRYLSACDRALEGLPERVSALGQAARLLCVGSGVDAISAAEQALKIEEGAWLPSTELHLETLLHGHLPAADEHTALIAFLLDPRARPERAARMCQALRAAGAVGVLSLVLASAEYLPELGEVADAGRLVVLPACASLGLAGALLAGAMALQRITLALSEKRATNPDLLRRDDVRYRTAALLGEHKLRMFAPPP
jgi:glucosamine--fructose-6-phosphate aminotransferase (isomerizing)